MHKATVENFYAENTGDDAIAFFNVKVDSPSLFVVWKIVLLSKFLLKYLQNCELSFSKQSFLFKLELTSVEELLVDMDSSIPERKRVIAFKK